MHEIYLNERLKPGKLQAAQRCKKGWKETEVSETGLLWMVRLELERVARNITYQFYVRVN